jgi:hypothetical protein
MKVMTCILAVLMCMACLCQALLESTLAGAVWETFVFAQLRARERNAGRAESLYF